MGRRELVGRARVVLVSYLFGGLKSFNEWWVVEESSLFVLVSYFFGG